MTIWGVVLNEITIWKIKIWFWGLILSLCKFEQTYQDETVHFPCRFFFNRNTLSVSFDIIWPQGTHTEKWLNHPKQCQVTFGLWTQTPLIGVGPVQTVRNTPQRFRWACLTYSLGFPTIFSVVFNGTGCDPPKFCSESAMMQRKQSPGGHSLVVSQCVLSVPSYPIFGGFQIKNIYNIIMFWSKEE